MHIPESIPSWPHPTPRELIEHSVAEELGAYHDRMEHGHHPVWLDLPQLRQAIDAGSVRFGTRDLTPPKVDIGIALRAAIEAVEDGVVLMFVDEQRITRLGQALDLTPSSHVRYIKLTALRGY